MLKLNLKPEPAWLEIGGGVRVKVPPLDTAILRAVEYTAWQAYAALIAENWIAFPVPMAGVPTLLAGTPTLSAAAGLTVDTATSGGFRCYVQSTAAIGNFSGSAIVTATSEL